MIALTEEKRHHKQNNVRSVWTTRQNQLNPIQIFKSRHNTVYVFRSKCTESARLSFARFAFTLFRVRLSISQPMCPVMCITAVMRAYDWYTKHHSLIRFLYWANKNNGFTVVIKRAFCFRSFVPVIDEWHADVAHKPCAMLRLN